MAKNREKGNKRDETEIPATTTFFGEIGEVNQNPRTDRRTQNALDETGKDKPANFLSDDNWSEKP